MDGLKFELVGEDETAGERVGAIIKVVGVGGCGCNIVNAMAEMGVHDADLIAVNTDIQSLRRVNVADKVQIGKMLTGGRGAGSKPEQGELAAEEDREYIANMLRGTDLLFIAAGLGGGTGSGAAPVIAEIARELDIMTVAVVITPFQMEMKNAGKQRIVETSMKRLKEKVNNIIGIPNDRIFQACDKQMPVTTAYMEVNRAIVNIINGMVYMISKTGYQNIDFEDVKTALKAEGDVFLGIGRAGGTDKIKKAFEKAMNDPFTGNAMLDGAKNILVNFAGCINLNELQEIDNLNKLTGENAFVKYGMVSDEELGDEIEVIVLVTGITEARPEKCAPEFRQEAPAAVQETETRHNPRDVALWSMKSFEGAYEDVDRPTYQRMMESRMFENKSLGKRLQ
ncbi:MAG TPA: cell division protein FtsZ [Candidatus Goldiibacteriota bacterium]|nr:cell division protein FtsZ [Candidatus Goldiibacteriota bacterium]HPN63967.1 cell division protein FtsZ [Candidatus Goldiibacteriota bacterium]HRQ43115.1 cell division protein FtsZ [Candidatus Goldiibacteriota bacterium]